VKFKFQVFPSQQDRKTNDLSFASTETKFIKPKTKTQNNFLVNTGFLVNFFQKKPKNNNILFL
jgi:hypothetical protein